MRKHTHRTVRDPMACITRRMPLRDEQQTDLGVAYHISLQAMLRGGTEQAWHTLACSLNIALVLSEQGYVGEGIDTIKLAQDALISSKRRSERTGKWAFSGDEAKIIMRAFAIHDEQCAIAPRGKIVEALREVHRRIEDAEVMA